MSFVKIKDVPTFVALMYKLTDFANPQRKVHSANSFLSKFPQDDSSNKRRRLSQLNLTTLRRGRQQ